MLRRNAVRMTLLLSSASATGAIRMTALARAQGARASPSLLAATSHSRTLGSGGVCAAAAEPSLEEQIKAEVEASKVVVYSKSWCPFCQQTKALFEALGVEYKAIELDQMDEGAAIQEALLGLTQQRTVPNVWVSGQHLGGNDDTQKAAKSGKLQELLE